MGKKIRFNNISDFIIFGGGELVFEICSYLIKNKKKILVISSSKQINEKIIFFGQSLKEYLIKNKIKFIILKNLDNQSKWGHLVDRETLGISSSCKWIFKQKEIDLFDGRLLNIHYSNLPSFRGGGGLTWNILMQNFQSGTTIHFIEKKIDAGFSIINKSFIFPKNIRNSLTKMQKYSMKIQKKIINEFLRKIVQKKFFYKKKIHSTFKSFYWPRLSTQKNAWINWTWDAYEIVNFINTFSHPYEGAATYLNKKVVRIQKARIKKENLVFHPFQYGLIYKIFKNKVYIGAKSEGIVIDIKDLKIKKGLLGKRLYTLNNKLEKSFEKAII